MRLFPALILSGALAGSLHAQTSTCSAQTAQTAQHAQHAQAAKDIVTTAVEAGSFKTLAAALQAGELVGALQGDGPFTVFAPSDAAFAKLPKGTLEMLLKPENKARLVELLKFHVVSGRVGAAEVVKLSAADTLNGQRLSIRAEEGAVAVGGAKVVQTDIACSNGVIHVVDSVLMPATDDLVTLAQKAGTFQTLLTAAKAAGLAETLMKGGPFTMLAPSDAAFDKLPAGTLESLVRPENKEKLARLLKAHVLEGRVFSDQVAALHEAPTLAGVPVAITKQGQGLVVGGARVLAADLQARNGVVHVIDSVIVPD